MNPHLPPTYTQSEVERMLTHRRVEGTDPLILTGATFSNQDFRGRDLRLLESPWCTWVDCNLTKVQMSNTTAHTSLFMQCTLTQANLSGTELRSTQLLDSTLNEANCEGCTWYQGLFSKVDAQHATFAGASMRGTQFTNGTDLAYTNFTRAGIQQVILDGIDCTCADFRESDCSGSSMQATDLSGADLSLSDLSLADLSGANLSGVTLAWATLFQTTFSSVEQLQETHLTPIANAFVNLLRRESYTKVKMYYDLLLRGEAPAPLVFFDLHPRMEEDTILSELNQERQEQIIVARFADIRQGKQAESHPINLILVDWLHTYLAH